MPVPKHDEAERLVTHHRGKLTPDQLDARIAEIWSDILASDARKQRVVKILGVQPDELPDLPPVTVKGNSGIEASLLYVVAQWTVTTIVVPVLIDMAKDELKPRLIRLWREVLLPAIRAENGAAIKD